MHQHVTSMGGLDTAAARDAAPFDEPWQAQSFACIMELSKRGYFTWAEWVDVFSAEITARPQRQGETASAAYYRQWLSALEAIVVARKLCSVDEIAAREAEWQRAYANTPHGLPIELAAAHAPACAAALPHQAQVGKPVTISPASR